MVPTTESPGEVLLLYQFQFFKKFFLNFIGAQSSNLHSFSGTYQGDKPRAVFLSDIYQGSIVYERQL
jgi:hypothetical protein